MLGGLDDIGAHPLGVDPGGLGEAGQDRLKRGSAHFDGLLDHVVQPGMLERGKDVGEVSEPVLGPGLLEDDEAVRPLAAFDRGLPLAVAAVERQNLGPGGKPQHIAEIIALVAVERNPGVLGKGDIDKQAGGTKIVGGHRSKVQFAAVINRKPPFRG
ncbi:hypothetical protein ACVWZ3_007551 [Bradyrhizobium sp. i1.3.6]